MIGYGAGIRRSEIVTLKWADILFSEHKIHVKQAKGNKDRIVMLPYSIVAYLQDYRRVFPSDDWDFTGQYKGEALSARADANPFLPEFDQYFCNRTKRETRFSQKVQTNYYVYVQ